MQGRCLGHVNYVFMEMWASCLLLKINCDLTQNSPRIKAIEGGDGQTVSDQLIYETEKGT